MPRQASGISCCRFKSDHKLVGTQARLAFEERQAQTEMAASEQ
jgi:hypothetical protein